MPAQCSLDQFAFGTAEGRTIVAAFDGGQVTSNAGALLLGATAKSIGLIARMEACFTDQRAPEAVEHTLETLLGQRVVALALGYEDLIDHDGLRHDPVLAALAGKLTAKRSRCAPLAGKSTLNRLEHAPEGQASRYHKITHDPDRIERLFVDLFLEAHASAPEEIVLDLDATDDPLHGKQEGRFFHGFYGHYCYLPLYIFCGDHLLVAKLRPANIDASAGAQEEVARVVAQVRAHWPKVRIVLRADSGFARDALMTWCEANDVAYVFGLARNTRLVAEIAAEQAQAADAAKASGEPERRFKELRYRTLNSWSCERRVVAKAEHLPQGANPRFVVTSLGQEAWSAQALYEQLYCARGEMENRIKECQLDLFADRTSAKSMGANQLRLWFASLAYVLLEALRRIGLAQTRLAQATCGRLRLTLLKVGALVRVSVRRVKIAMASGHPYRQEWATAYARLCRAPA